MSVVFDEIIGTVGDGAAAAISEVVETGGQGGGGAPKQRDISRAIRRQARRAARLRAT